MINLWSTGQLWIHILHVISTLNIRFLEIPCLKKVQHLSGSSVWVVSNNEYLEFNATTHVANFSCCPLQVSPSKEWIQALIWMWEWPPFSPLNLPPWLNLRRHLSYMLMNNQNLSWPPVNHLTQALTISWTNLQVNLNST